MEPACQQPQSGSRGPSCMHLSLDQGAQAACTGHNGLSGAAAGMPVGRVQVLGDERQPHAGGGLHASLPKHLHMAMAPAQQDHLLHRQRTGHVKVPCELVACWEAGLSLCRRGAEERGLRRQRGAAGSAKAQGAKLGGWPANGWWWPTCNTGCGAGGMAPAFISSCQA